MNRSGLRERASDARGRDLQSIMAEMGTMKSGRQNGVSKYRKAVVGRMH